MAAASGHTVSGVSERGPAINQGPHQIQNQASVKEVWSLSSVPRVSFSCFLFFLALHPVMMTGREG